MARYERNHRGMDQLGTSRRVAAHMRRVGGMWKEKLEATAPRETGEYIRSLSVDNEIVTIRDDRGRAMPRWAVNINATARYAAALEYGSADVPSPPRPLTKLLDEINAADPNRGRQSRRRARGR